MFGIVAGVVESTYALDITPDKTTVINITVDLESILVQSVATGIQEYLIKVAVLFLVWFLFLLFVRS